MSRSAIQFETDKGLSKEHIAYLDDPGIPTGDKVKFLRDLYVSDAIDYEMLVNELAELGESLS